MINELKIFENPEFGKVRTTVLDGEPWFVAKDVAVALGYKDPANAIKSHCKGVVKHHPLETAGGTQEVRIIRESDVYRLIIRSKLPGAEKFEKWLMEDVLPSIRKHGAYMTEDKLEEILQDTDKFLDLAIKLREEKRKAIEERNKAVREKAWIGTRREATAMATASVATKEAKKLKVLLDESKEWATVKKVELALGGKYDWRRLKQASAAMKIPPRKVPDINYGQVNAYHNSVWLAVYGVDISVLS